MNGAAHVDSTFSRLPPQLLALVLARLQPAERLGSMARVCSAWRAAAVMATNSISANAYQRGRVDSMQDRMTALSGWLHAHAAAAALDSLTVTGYSTRLQLPVQQLASLRCLDLDDLTVAVQGQAGAQAAATDLPPELCAITRLRLCTCEVGLSTLPAFTNLQHLVIYSRDPPSSSPDISGLLHLTSLQLSGGCAQDGMLGSVGALTSLQELHVDGASYLCTAAGFAALPVSLTMLCVTMQGRPHYNEPLPIVTLAPADTPAIAALTALRWFEVENAAGFSAVLLRDMSSLQHLAVRDTPLLAVGEQGVVQEGGGLGLAALSGLTQLQHLELPQTRSQLAAAPTAADVAALTASSQLTCLIINGGLVKQEQYRHMFPEQGRQLPELRELQATMGLLGTRDDTVNLVHCCPNLEELDVSEAMPNEPVFDLYDDWGGGEYCSVGVLSDWTYLTRLVLDVQDNECNEEFWSGLALVTSLKSLHIHELGQAYFGGIVCLAQCRQLTYLEIKHSDNGYFELQTPYLEPPDIWHRLSYEAMHAALEHFKKASFYGDDVQGALQSMTRAAAEHSKVLERETKELRATVASLESRQQQRDEQQREEVAGLQMTVAALGAQVQALLQQVSMQQAGPG